jgi:hypothetical protein
MGGALADIDADIVRLRDQLGVGFAITVVAPINAPGFETCRIGLSWHRLSALQAHLPTATRITFVSTLRAGLDYMFEYEKRVDRDGEEATHRWHLEQRTIREKEMDRLIEEVRKVRAR